MSDGSTIYSGFSGINVADLLPIHVDTIIPQEEQAGFRDEMPKDIGLFLETTGESKVITDNSGEIVSICGVLAINGEAITWAVHSNLFKKHVLEVTRAFNDFVVSILESDEFNKVIGFVRNGFDAGHRWLRLLGFALNVNRHDFGSGHSVYERTI